MNQFAGRVVILLFVLLLGYLLYRFSRRQVGKIIPHQKSLDDSEIWLRNKSPVKAVVVSKNETINTNAHGIAKVDLDLKIFIPSGEPVETKTCWLVELPALPQLEPGQSVLVKFDPKRPKRVFPAVPWARAWLF